MTPRLPGSAAAPISRLQRCTGSGEDQCAFAVDKLRGPCRTSNGCPGGSCAVGAGQATSEPYTARRTAELWRRQDSRGTTTTAGRIAYMRAQILDLRPILSPQRTRACWRSMRPTSFGDITSPRSIRARSRQTSRYPVSGSPMSTSCDTRRAEPTLGACRRRRGSRAPAVTFQGICASRASFKRFCSVTTSPKWPGPASSN